MLSGSPGAYNGQQSGLKCVFRLCSDWRLPSTWLNAGSIIFPSPRFETAQPHSCQKMKMWDIANFTLFPSGIFMGQSKTYREIGAVNVLHTLYSQQTHLHPPWSRLCWYWTSWISQYAKLYLKTESELLKQVQLLFDFCCLSFLNVYSLWSTKTVPQSVTDTNSFLALRYFCYGGNIMRRS